MDWLISWRSHKFILTNENISCPSTWRQWSLPIGPPSKLSEQAPRDHLRRLKRLSKKAWRHNVRVLVSYWMSITQTNCRHKHCKIRLVWRLIDEALLVSIIDHSEGHVSRRHASRNWPRIDLSVHKYMIPDYLYLVKHLPELEATE